MKKVFHVLYKVKFYFNVCAQQIGFITSKFPEFMAVLYLLEKMGVVIQRELLIPLALFFFVSFVSTGFVWKRLGYYDIEQYVNAAKDPVQHEILQAARKINEKK